MIEITFNAFSFVRPKLARHNVAYSEARRMVPEGSSIRELIAQLGLAPGDVEAAFVNNAIVPLDTVLAHKDRVALVPPGTPGPYRVMLGMVKVPGAKDIADNDQGGIKHET